METAEDRQSEQVLLHALAGEFNNNREQLNEVINVNQRRMAAVSALLEQKANPATVETEYLEKQWKWVMRGEIYSPASGVLDSAVNSGMPPTNSEIDFELLGGSTVVENFLREEAAWGRVATRIAQELDEKNAEILERIDKSLLEL